MDGQTLTKEHEGYREDIYLDSLGYPTTGYGNCLDYTHRYSSVREWHESQFRKHYKEAQDLYRSLNLQLDPIREAAVVDLCYNLGRKFLKFNQTIEALRKGQFTLASDCLKNSIWYTQVGCRGRRICRIIETGDWGND